VGLKKKAKVVLCLILCLQSFKVLPQELEVIYFALKTLQCFPVVYPNSKLVHVLFLIAVFKLFLISKIQQR